MLSQAWAEAARAENDNHTTSGNIELNSFLPHLDISWTSNTAGAIANVDANHSEIYSTVKPQSTALQEHTYENLEQYENTALSLQSLRLNSTLSLGRAILRGDIEEIREIVLHKNFHVDALDDHGLTALHHAARENNLEAAKILLENGAKIDARDKFGSTPLQTATRYNAAEIVATLLSEGANPCSEQDLVSGCTPLHLAASCGSTEVIRYLLKDKRVDANITDLQGVTALQRACSRGHAELCAILLQHGARVDIRAQEGMTALHYAASNADPKIVSLLLNWEWQRHFNDSMRNAESRRRYENQKYHEFLNCRDAEQNTSLHLAAQTGNSSVSEILIEQGAAIDLRNTALQTPLHLAAIYGSPEVLTLIIRKGGDVNSQDNQGKTPLHSAAILGNVECARILVGSAADPEIPDDNNMTPFLSAVSAGHTDCAKLLLESGVDVKPRDMRLRCCVHLAVENEKLETLTMLLSETGSELVNAGDYVERTPLHYAAIVGDVKILKTLLENNANCFLKDSSCKTPLHFASERGNVRHVQVLAQAGQACVSQLDEFKRTPLHYAVVNKHKKVLSDLLEIGADINPPDIDGWTPLIWAAKTGSVDFIRVLLEKHADLDHADVEGNTVLHVTARYSHGEVMQLLLDQGAKVLTNKNGMTCSHVAMEFQNSDVIMAIVKHQRWKDVLLIKGPDIANPMERLIQRFPEAAEVVLDRCVQRSTSKRRVTYDFHLLDPGPDDESGREGGRFFGLETIFDCNQQNLLMHPLSRKLLKIKWRKFGLTIYLANLILYLTFVCTVSIFALTERKELSIPLNHTNRANLPPDFFKGKNKSNEIIPYIVSLFALVHLFKEIYQLVTQRSRYFKDPSNYLECILYVTMIVFMLPYTLQVNAILDNSPTLFWQVGTVAVFLSYADLVFFLQTMDYVGLYVTMFLEIMKTLCKVLFLFIMFGFAFALVFFILFKEQPDFASIALSFVKVFVMTTGEFEYSTILVSSVSDTNPDTGAPLVPYQALSMVFFVVFVLAMTFVLSNLLVGLAVGDIESIRQSASMRNKGRQIRFIVEVEKKYPKFITRQLYKPVVVSKLKKDKHKYWKAEGYQDEDLMEDDEFGVLEREERRFQSLDDEFSKIKARQKELASMMEQQRELLNAIASKIGIGINN